MLPTIQHPIFTLDLPLSKRKIRFRPLLVKEEKMLLVAKESGVHEDIIENVRAVITNCVLDKIDFDNFPLLEVEFLFLHLRAKSISNIIRLRIIDEFDENIKHDIDIDVDEIKIEVDKDNDKKIKLDSNLGLIMKYPSFNSLKKIKNIDDKDSDFYSSLMNSIESVYDKESVYKFNDASDNEKIDFIDSLSSQHLEQIKNFYLTLPKMIKKIEYVNSKGNKSELILDNFYDFF